MRLLFTLVLGLLLAPALTRAQPVEGTYELDRDLAFTRIVAVADSLINAAKAVGGEVEAEAIREMEGLKAGARANLDAMTLSAQFNADSTFQMVMSAPSQPAVPINGSWVYPNSAGEISLEVEEIGGAPPQQQEVVSVPIKEDVITLAGFVSIDVPLRRTD